MAREQYIAASATLFGAASPGVKLALSRIKPERLYPPFLGKLLAGLEQLAAQKQAFWVTCGERSWEEQHQIYLVGREPGHGKPGHFSTKVDAGGSAHQYCIAADGAYDLDPVRPGLQPSWDDKYMRIWAECHRDHGLDPGFFWSGFKDGPHVQLGIRARKISPGKQLKAEYLKKNDILDVFGYLDNFSW